MDVQVDAINIKKVFNRRVIFENISFSLSQRQTLAVTGRNGAGKSTLVKIVSNVLTPTGGRVTISCPTIIVANPHLALLGLVSPYLTLYDEFSAQENLRFALAIRGLQSDDQFINVLLKRVSLHTRGDDIVRTYSSGMKQRLKYAFALVHHPPILILDEPMANLDSDGIRIVREIMIEHREHGILMVASNNLSDIDRFDILVDLDAVN
ncbi:MAG: ABC transporter ATP-binding protein [Ignavibacteria bacterium]|nr:ABC transporter ATP-binding protein [Ignavibacteria bacterium]